jgi:hypothetical protein
VPRFCCFVAMLVVVFLIDSAAESAEVKFRAPVSCPVQNFQDLKKANLAPSCGSDESLEAVQRRYREVLHARENCSATENKWACRGELRAFTISYPPCNEGNKSLGGPEFMAPVSNLLEGTSKLQSILESAQSGQPFEGQYQIIETTSSIPNEQHLALCDIRIVAGVETQPRDCETVAIITPRETWLRGQAGLPVVPKKGNVLCQVSASFRPSGAIDISFEVKSGADIVELANAVKTTLRDEMKLSPTMSVTEIPTGKPFYISIKSAAPLRNSEILPSGWREAIDFDVDLRVFPSGVDIVGTAHTSVCRTASGSLTEYQGTNDAQRSQYAEVFNSHILSAIKHACKSAAVIDDRTVLCEAPKATNR